MTIPTWLTGAALFSRLQWVTSKNSHQFMGSSLGQTIQTITIATAGLFAAFRAGKAVTTGSYIDTVPSLIYGVTAVFAWIGKNMALRLVQIEGSVNQIVEEENEQAINAAEMIRTLQTTKKSLLDAKSWIEALEKQNSQLIENFTTAQEHLEIQAEAIRQSEAAAIKAAAAFETLKGKKNFYKAECENLRRQIQALSKKSI